MKPLQLPKTMKSLLINSSPVCSQPLVLVPTPPPPRRTLLLKKWALLAALSVELLIFGLIILYRRTVFRAVMLKVIDVMAISIPESQRESVMADTTDSVTLFLLCLTPLVLLVTAYFAYGIQEELRKTVHFYSTGLLTSALFISIAGVLISPIFFLLVPFYVAVFMVARSYGQDLEAAELAKMAALVVSGVVESGAKGELAFRKV